MRFPSVFIRIGTTAWATIQRLAFGNGTVLGLSFITLQRLVRFGPLHGLSVYVYGLIPGFIGHRCCNIDGDQAFRRIDRSNNLWFQP